MLSVATHLRRATFKKINGNAMGTIAFEKFGPPSDVLSFSSGVQGAEPGAGQVKVTIQANQVSAEDIRMIRGQSFSNKTIGVAGTSGAGVVSSVASGETAFAVNDPVLVLASGVWTDSFTVDKSSVIKIPKMPADAAASLPVAISAYTMLTNYTSLSSGDTVVQTNGGTAMGLAVSAICKSMGVKVVSASAADLADKAFVKKTTGAKLAITTLQGRASTSLVKMLADGSTLVAYNAPPLPLAVCAPLDLSTSSLIFNNISTQGFDLSAWSKSNPEEVSKAVAAVVQLVAEKKISLAPSKTYSQNQFLEAISDMESSGNSAVLKL